MGQGYFLTCPLCNYCETFMLGIGMWDNKNEGFGSYFEIEEDVLSGKFGAEFKKLYEEDGVSLLFNEGTELYQCPNCHTLGSRKNLSIYTSNKTYYFCPPPYRRDWLEKNYTLAKQYIPRCPTCSKPMTMVSDDGEIKKADLSCPKCGALLVVHGGICWD